MRYDVAGVETYSSGYTPSSTFNFNTASSARTTFERFVVGSSHPCWYDPRDPRTVLLARGPGGAYLFALFPLPVLALGVVRDVRRTAAAKRRPTPQSVGQLNLWSLRPKAERIDMRARQLSGWHLTTLIMAFAAVIAVAAVALVFGTEAVIGIVVAIVIGIALVSWFLNG